MTLLRGGGRSSTTEITRSILAHDESQVEYYEGMTKNMVGRALRSHGIVEKEDGGYALVGFEDLDGEQIEHLIGLCESKLDDYKTRRGRRIWQHRRISAGYISDFRTVRASYDRREPGCPFCEMPKDQLVAETELAYAVRDAFPATSLHTLVIPKRHVRDCFELRRPELDACHRLLEQRSGRLSRRTRV
jgi:hypothetical protein